jgi:hypothetical protein
MFTVYFTNFDYSRQFSTLGAPANDSPAFANFQTLASAWDAANPGATGSIVLNIPNSTCWFLGSGIAPFKWAMNPSGYDLQMLNGEVRATGIGRLAPPKWRD